MKTKAWAVCLKSFGAQGRLNEAALRTHLAHIRDACAYVGSSNVGEGFTFSSEARDHVFAIAADECRGKIPVRPPRIAISDAEADDMYAAYRSMKLPHAPEAP